MKKTLTNNWPLGGHIKTTLFVATFLATAIGSPTIAFAADDKVFAGAACVPEQGPQLSTLAYPYGTVQNQGTQTTTVNCPIVRDNTTNTSGATVTVRYSFGSPVSTAGLGCGLWSFDPNKVPPGAYPMGFLTTQQFPGSYTTGSTYSMTLSLPSSNITANSRGQYVLFCQLPKGASVLSYLVSEPD